MSRNVMVPRKALSPQRKSWGFNLSLLVLVVVVIAIAVWTLPGSAVYQVGQSYSFEYSVKATTKANDGRTVETRLFIFGDGQTFSAPVESFGRPITVADKTMPPNTFKLVVRRVPELRIGSQMFDPGDEYVEVRYNMSRTEVQGVVPNITPKNEPPGKK